MIERNKGRITSVAWTEICPWLIIFRAFRLAIRARFLIISAVAILATTAGWDVLGRLFANIDDPHLQQSIAVITSPENCPWTALTSMVPDSPRYPNPQAGNSITAAWTQLSAPFQRMFNLEVSLAETAFWLFCGLWAVLIWSFAGGAITRTAAVQLAAEEKLGWSAMCGYVLARWRSYFMAPVLPLLGVLLVTIPILLLGLLLRTNVTTWLAGLLWFLPLAGSFLLAILMLGLFFGWPLMWATISSEGSDSFDALSRSYAYAFQRPLQYLLYILVAAVFGGLGWVLVMNFAAGVVHLAYWSAGFGAGQENVAAIVAGKPSAGGGASMLHFWTGCVKILAVGYLYSYFWTATTSIYFVLRRDVDATEMDEVFLEEDAAAAAFGLPVVGTDERGAPVVEEEAVAASDAATEDSAAQNADASSTEDADTGSKPTDPRPDDE